MQRAEIEELLTKAKELLKPEVTSIAYTTWIVPLEIDSMENSIITFHVATDVHRDMIAGRYASLIKNTFSFLTNIDYDIEVISDEELQASGNMINKSSTSSSSVSTNFTYSKSNLNSKYTFDSFVVGENNRFAHAAALAVSEAPGTAYNPLFLYGGVGLGKTHLMHAIGNEILKHNKNANVLYVTSEQFNNNLIAGIKEGKMDNFQNKCQVMLFMHFNICDFSEKILH